MRRFGQGARRCTLFSSPVRLYPPCEAGEGVFMRLFFSEPSAFAGRSFFVPVTLLCAGVLLIKEVSDDT